MRFYSTEALILDVQDLQDRDRIVAFLTREQGQKRGVARGARRPHSRFAGELQPLAKVRLHWGEKEGRDLVRISGVELLRPARRLQEDLDGILVGAYLADHMLELVQDNEPGDLYFRLLDSTLEALEAGVDRDLAARYFEAWALRLAGVYPPPRSCPVCGEPFAESGAVLLPGGDALLCPRCAGPAAATAGAFVAGPELLGFLRVIGHVGLAALAAGGGLDAALLRQAEELAGRVRRGFLQRELRSYEVMQRTLAGP